MDWVTGLLDWLSSIFILLPVAAALVPTLILLVHIYNSRRSSRVDQAKLYFDISDRWSKILKILYDVRSAPPPTRAELEDDYGADFARFMRCDEWRESYRPICNFFEDIGLMVYKKNISVEELQVLVTIIPADYHLMKPVLDYLRKHYRSDIYVFWNYLLDKAYDGDRARTLHPYKDKTMYEPPAPKEGAR